MVTPSEADSYHEELGEEEDNLLLSFYFSIISISK